jgi:RND family efflux transporter MFP subunit
MKLEPVYSDAIGAYAQTVPTAAQLPPGSVQIDAATQRLMGIQLAPVERGNSARQIKVVGRVVPQDTRVYKVNAGVDGFIRETTQDSVGTRVKKDQKLATYFAPEVLAPASGFLAAIQAVPGSVGKDGAKTVPFPGALVKQGVSSVQGYTDRLRNLGMSDQQIQSMAVSHQLPESIDVVAPADGFIVARNISAGQHFEHNMEFYRVADLGRVWVLAEVSEREASYLHAGGAAKITLRDAGRQLSARISDSLPQSESGGGTVKLRLEADNPSFLLRPEMLVDVEVNVPMPAGITVPINAVVDSGARSRVYVEHGDGIFEPREVETGWRVADRVEILRGVQPGDQVVSSATFLVDSESRLKNPSPEPSLTRTTASRINAGVKTVAVSSPTTVKDPSCGMEVNKAAAVASGNSLVDGGTTYYFCSKKCKEAFHHDTAASMREKRGI